jgi:hypothetical protein
MGKQIYHRLVFYIYLDDAAEVAANQATEPVWVSPQAAALTYDAPVIQLTDPTPADGRYITSEWIGTDENFPSSQASFTRKTGGWFGISWLFGDTHYYDWNGYFKLSPSLTAVPPGETRVAITRRRWIDGFELQPDGEGSILATYWQALSPTASRHPGGMGLMVRDSFAAHTHRHDQPELDADYPTDAWERFYLRVRRYPVSAHQIWRVQSLPNTNQGMALHLGPDGRVTVYGLNATSVLSLYGTVTEALTIDEWTKVDLVYKAGTGGYFKVFYNGVQVFSMLVGSMSSGVGLYGVTGLTTATLGSSAHSHGGAWDYDDWIGGELPTGFTADASGGLSMDWLHGSRVMIAHPKAFATANDGNFAGPGGADASDWRLLRGRPTQWGNPEGTGVLLSSSVSEAKLAVVIDTVPVFATRGVLGWTAMLAAFRSSHASGSTPTIGYKLPGAAEVTADGAESTTYGWARAAYFPDDIGTDPKAALETGLEISYKGAATAVARSIVQAAVAFELIGDFFAEDHVALTSDPEDLAAGLLHSKSQLHNHPYPDTPWAVAGADNAPPISPVVVKGGTYVGNGTSTQLAFRAPVNLLIIRKTTTNAGPSLIWLAGGVTGHTSWYQEGQGSVYAMVDRSFAPPAAEGDQSMQVLVRLLGNGASVNENGTTYNYIAFMDPGLRFLEVGAFREVSSGLSVDVIHQLAGGWSPDCMWVVVNAGQSSTLGWNEIGSGCVAPQAFRFGSSSYATGLTIGEEGAITLPAGSSLLSTQGAAAAPEFAAFRQDDLSEDDDARKILSHVSYTGDGAASRTIMFSPATGRRPMWAIVTGSNGNTRFRDASFTGTQSTTPAASASASDGITGGGVDSLSVGSALNTNGVVFDVLVFWAADATAGNNGFGTNGENAILPGSPANGPDAPWGEEPGAPAEPEEPEEPEEPGIPGSPGQEEEYDFSDDCIDGSTKIINIALARLGISKQVGDITTETSAEATAARLNYSNDVSATLRDFPWPFATRYQKLELIAGDASEQDTVQGWLATRTYEVGQVVRISDVDYYCTVEHLNHQPPDASYWSDEAPDEVNGDWLYAYRTPDNFVFARRLVNNATKTRRTYDLKPPPFKLGSDNYTTLIYSNERNAELEYTVRLACAADVGDAIFRSALAWRHAHSMAGALARDEKKIAYCWAMYDAVLNQAKRWAASEQQFEPEGNADWISARE